MESPGGAKKIKSDIGEEVLSWGFLNKEWPFARIQDTRGSI